jgi:hypothetical protein
MSGRLTAKEIESAAIANAYDFSGDVKVIAVGGGVGTLLATLLQTHRRLTGVVFDRPHVIADAECLFEQMDLSDRAAWAGGDFFSALPGGGDIYLLKSVIHNWDDAAAVRLLRCCRRAMAAGARLLIAERLLDVADNRGDTPGNGGSPGVRGQQRSEDQFRQLLSDSDFRWSRLIRTESSLTLIEAFAVDAPRPENACAQPGGESSK